ncbi:hypothetical protein NS220_01445 [Microbacterium testaceum]|uniref:VanZ-like domain-containing protein n=1 Tax=Microbacterium testaceum TaxID=2033 RepID=A0A147F153_MICTE|nr:VanZ family protein [Microbacterium testaceum]KTR96588.1 hypothetical protein NS220_01445 [Microbacterium testaceum]
MPNAPVLTPARILVAAAALAVVGALTLAPRALIRPFQERAVDAFFLVTERWGGVTPAYSSDVVMNIALFVPLGLAVAALLPLRFAPLTVLFAAAVSLAVETAQSLIPGRVPDADDVLHNTLGAAVGALVVIALRLVTRAAVRAGEMASRG